MGKFTVLQVIKPIQHYIKFPKLWIDNTVFRLHAKLSVLFLFAGCMLISVDQFLGRPIDCLVTKGRIGQEMMNTYCWIHSTFVLPKNVSMEEAPQDSLVEAHPGVGTFQQDSRVVEHKYYQWVCFVLIAQGLCFLAPYHLWKKWEGGKTGETIPAQLNHQVSDKRMPCFATNQNLISKAQVQEAVASMKERILEDSANGKYSHLLKKFAFCETLNFLNVVMQIFFIDVFLGGVFTTYGRDVFWMSQEDPDRRMDPMDRVFPKVGKCTFNKFGPSGTLEKIDGMCILSLNIINEKIYILLWFWFILLAVVSVLQLIYRLATLCSPAIRQLILSVVSEESQHVNALCKNLTEGQWFTLILISKNIDRRIFSQLIRELTVSPQKRKTV